MSRYCLDTSAYIEFLRGDPTAVAAIDGASWIGFPAIALGELYTGFSLSGQPEGEAARLRDFLAHPVVEGIPVDDEVAREYGHLVADLRRANKPLPANDLDRGMRRPHFQRRPDPRCSLHAYRACRVRGAAAEVLRFRGAYGGTPTKTAQSIASGGGASAPGRL